jgi:hypothetical protein
LRSGERKGVGWRWGAILIGGPQLAARGERKKGKEKGLMSGPQVSATGKKEKRERGRCWAAAANRPEEGAGPCGVRWAVGFWAKREG